MKSLAHLLILPLVCGLACNHAAKGQVITTFQDAFQLTTPAPGWSYLWNMNGPIGNPANYSALLPTPAGNYTSDGMATPRPSPAGYVSFRTADGVPGGHPGAGANQAGAGGIERYAIASYTLAEQSELWIVNGWLRNENPNQGGSTDGLNLKVFVNQEDSPRLSTTTAPGVDSFTTFSAYLGVLGSGSTVYVAVGSNLVDSFDAFQLRYGLSTVPEPGSLSLIGMASAIGLAACRRVRRRSLKRIA